MSTLFTRLFKPTAKTTDGLTQPQREAIVDLLNFCSYADDRLTLAEDKVVSDQLALCEWHPAVPLELFVSRSVTRARTALESPDQRAGFLSDIAERLENSPARTRALELCKILFRADGAYAKDEETTFSEIERIFRASRGN
jgi:hypothetical protein